MLSDGKIPWHSSLKAAAEEVIKNYDKDYQNSSRQYGSLRDASNDFFDQHSFVRDPNETKDMLYANVRKVKSL